MLLSQLNLCGTAYGKAAGTLKQNLCQLGFSPSGTQSKWDTAARGTHRAYRVDSDVGGGLGDGLPDDAGQAHEIAAQDRAHVMRTVATRKKALHDRREGLRPNEADGAGWILTGW